MRGLLQVMVAVARRKSGAAPLVRTEFPATTARLRCCATATVLASMLGLQALGEAHACEVVDRPQYQVPVLELFTSEGCNSCPPASRWLRQFDTRSDLAIVEFHVDYWDGLGWRDPFGDARFSARQRERAARRASRTVYTPDVAYAGDSRNDWARGWVPPRSKAAAPFVLEARAELSAQRRLAVRWSSQGAPANSRAWIAVTQSGLASVPARGENGGVRLQHSHVARVFEAGLDPHAGSIDIALPADLDINDARVQLVVEDEAQARPLHAVVLPLSSCAGKSSALNASRLYGSSARASAPALEAVQPARETASGA